MGVALAGALVGALAAAAQAADDPPAWQASLRGVYESHVGSAASPFAPASNLMQTGSDLWREEVEVRGSFADWRAVATASSWQTEHSAGERRAWFNELVYERPLWGGYVSAGKKIMSWDVGYGFRPLDVLQQENRRVSYFSTLEGVPMLAFETFGEASAWTFVFANPGGRRGNEARDDPSLALRYFRQSGGVDLHAVLRASERNGFEAGVAVAAVVSDAIELHASMLHQQRYQKSINALIDSAGGLLPANDPTVIREFQGGYRALLGATFTTESKFSLIAEIWYDANAHSARDWQQLWALTERQTALAGRPGVPATAVPGNLAYDTGYYNTPNALPANAMLRLSQRVGEADVSFDHLRSLADGGSVSTLSAAWSGERWHLEGGMRVLGGASGSAYRNAPEHRIAFLIAQYSF